MKNLFNFKKFVLNEYKEPMESIISENFQEDAINSIPEDIIKKIYDAIIKRPTKATSILSKLSKVSPLLYKRIKEVAGENLDSLETSTDLGDLGF